MAPEKQSQWVLDQNITWFQSQLKAGTGPWERIALLQLLAREQEKLKALLASD